MGRYFSLVFGLFLLSFTACADELRVRVHALNTDAATHGIGKDLGEIWVKDTDEGVLFVVYIEGLAPGMHGFHVHENGSCEYGMKDGKIVPGLAAGDHFDPAHTHQHRGPYDTHGHLGDLPPLKCDEHSCQALLMAPRMGCKELGEIKGRSLIIHEHGDNFSDKPLPLGGGGPRVACAVLK